MLVAHPVPAVGCETSISFEARPWIVRLAPECPNLVVAQFACMKTLPAAYMLSEAKRRGDLRPDSTVIDTSSGTFALGLSMVCAREHLALEIVTDPAVDAALRARIEDLGACVRYACVSGTSGDVQSVRMQILRDRLAELGPAGFRPNQYDHPDNAAAYHALASMIVEAVGVPSVLVASVGSGGSSNGTARYLRVFNPQLRVVGVDTQGSVLFGMPKGPRALRGLGNSLLPKNLDHRAYDEVQWVPAAVAFRATRLLHQRHQVYAGPTTGAAYWAARWHAMRNPEQLVVFIGPDSGHRYATSVYEDGALRAEGQYLAAADMPDAPCSVRHPTEVGSEWSAYAWSRRSLEEVVGTSSANGRAS